MATLHASLFPFVACTLAAAMPACYQPVIGDGTLACNNDACPQGFLCDQPMRVCRRPSGGGLGLDATDAGACGDATPPTFGQACGSCGGKILCDGSCSIAVDLGAACGGCGGRLHCDGSCDIPTPTNLGVACGRCGGTIQCNGTCSIADSAGLGTTCGSCGGTLECGGQCSVATPADFGTVITQPVSDSFSCCFMDETRSYGPSGRNTIGCFAGYAFGGCTVAKGSGGGAVTVLTEDADTCSCQVHINNIGFEGATYLVNIRQIRGC